MMNGSGCHDDAVAELEGQLEEINEAKVLLDIEMAENLIETDEIESELMNASNSLRISLTYLKVKNYIYIYIYIYAGGVCKGYIYMPFIYFLTPERYKIFMFYFVIKMRIIFYPKGFLTPWWVFGNVTRFW